MLHISVIPANLFIFVIPANPLLPSPRRKSGPRLSECVLVASLGPGFRRDDELRSAFVGVTKLKKFAAISQCLWAQNVSHMGKDKIAALHSQFD
jgi:hypothetical protein